MRGRVCVWGGGSHAPRLPLLPPPPAAQPPLHRPAHPTASPPPRIHTHTHAPPLHRSPGLLVDVVSVLKDINVNVVSAEIDTIGDRAQDELFVTYHGEPLTGPMVQLVTNALQYYLSIAEVAKEESY